MVVLRELLPQALMQLARRWVSQADALKGRLEMHPLDLQVRLKRADGVVIAAVCFEGLRVLLQRPYDDWQHAESKPYCLRHCWGLERSLVASYVRRACRCMEIDAERSASENIPSSHASLQSHSLMQDTVLTCGDGVLLGAMHFHQVRSEGAETTESRRFDGVGLKGIASLLDRGS